MTKKMCKHNKMSEVLPKLWIGGTRKHTEITNDVYLYGWNTRRVRVVESEPTKYVSNTRYFLCPNYGVPNVKLNWWINEIARYQKDATADPAYGVTTVVTDLGGHGRSGLYCAIIMAHVLGIDGQEAIAQLRQMHCEQAVETAEQEAYVVRIADELRNWKG